MKYLICFSLFALQYTNNSFGAFQVTDGTVNYVNQSAGSKFSKEELQKIADRNPGITNSIGLVRAARNAQSAFSPTNKKADSKPAPASQPAPAAQPAAKQGGLNITEGASNNAIGSAAKILLDQSGYSFDQEAGQALLNQMGVNIANNEQSHMLGRLSKSKKNKQMKKRSKRGYAY